MRIFTGEELVKVRHILGMSQRELASVVGCSQPLINKIEIGQRRLTSKVNERIQTEIFRYIDKETLFKMLDGEIEFK
ncbi:helix-turn-helix domain-containing protein [Cytobacillus sp. NJ13]|nr:helix-turn-helix domain-containing protein [Cytobacillus sp. NJ13]